MRTRPNRRHALLLFGALVVPCVVVVALGFKIIADDHELTRAKLASEPPRIVARIAVELTNRLERIKFDQAASLSAPLAPGAVAPPLHPDVAFVGWIREGRLLLPWDEDPAPAAAAEALRRPFFGDSIAEGERLESGPERFQQAAVAYQRARGEARTPFERDYADFLRARVLDKDPCACRHDARQIYDRLLSSTAVDDQGMPLALYAATVLVGRGAAHAQVLDLLVRRLDRRAWAPPEVAYRERDLLKALVSSAPETEQRQRAETQLTAVERDLREQEQMLRLQREFSTSIEGESGQEPVWRLFGTTEWLVSEGPALAGLPPFVIAVRSAPVFAALRSDPALSAETSDALEFVTAGAAGLAVGDRFPGLRAAFPAADEQTALSQAARRRTFYVLALASVLIVTLLGGYVLVRDVRREMEMADMRAQFVASVSHELRTPLTAIRMFAETLLMERPLGASGRADYLNTIVNESERLTRLINNVLDFSRIERDQKAYRLEPAALEVVVQQAADTMQYPLARQGFQLQLATTEVPVIPIDADAMQQALLNLLSNAMKYSGDQRRIALTLGRVNGHVVIAVQDYGLGIAPRDQTRVFERFYRAPIQENTRIPGAGLGLSLVDHIVKAHGGFVTVTSAPGEGSTFAIHLPLEAHS